MEYEKDIVRKASSELMTELLGDVSRSRDLLQKEKMNILSQYNDESILNSIFASLDARIINLCPMTLCDRMLCDLGVASSDELLAGLGLAMYSISTHDDIVDEFPRDRLVVAGLLYGGNIATLEGLKILCEAGLNHVASEVIACVNKNHYYQTKIVTSLWDHPCDKDDYLSAISHTGYWAEIGLRAALAFSQKQGLSDFVSEFAKCYGLTCQLFDDMREIDDDVKNGYWSLPVSLARFNGWDISTDEGKRLSIETSRSLAEGYIKKAKELCGNRFPSLLDLVERIEKAGSGIQY
jgi:hypothetical protein